MYQKMKNWIEALAGKLTINKILEKPWIYLIVNFIMKLLLAAEKNMILVVCDRLSKIMYFMTTIEETLVERLAWLFRNNIWKLHGLPECVISDRRLQFVAELTKELNRMLGIETKLLTLFLSTNKWLDWAN